MKARLLLLSLFVTFQNPIWADIDIDGQDISQEIISKPTKRTPFSFNTHVDVVEKSKINKGFYKGDGISFAEAEVEAAMVVYYNPRYTEGLRASLSYSATYLHWGDNPCFDQDHFNIASITLSGFSMRADDWFWRAQMTANFDTDNWSGAYTSYDLILWGRYTLCNKFGVHFGFLAQTGLKMDRVYPILGFDWQITRDLKLSLVYPVDVALIYTCTKNWSIGAAGRFFNSRFRVNKNEYSQKPLVRYVNFGTELVVKYDNDTMSANIHVGSVLRGIYRLANRYNNHATNYYLNPSLYAGAEIDVKF